MIGPSPTEESRPVAAPPPPVRAVSQRRIPAALVIAAAALLVARVAADRGPLPRTGAGWPSLEAAVAAAEEERRPLLLVFTADWCVPCKVFEREVLSDLRVRIALEEHFERTRLVNSRDPARCTPGDAAIRERLGVPGFPAALVIVAGGERPLVAPTTSAADFLSFLEEARLRHLTARRAGRGVDASALREAALSGSSPTPSP